MNSNFCIDLRFFVFFIFRRLTICFFFLSIRVFRWRLIVIVFFIRILISFFILERVLINIIILFIIVLWIVWRVVFSFSRIIFLYFYLFRSFFYSKRLLLRVIFVVDYFCFRRSFSWWKSGIIVIEIIFIYFFILFRIWLGKEELGRSRLRSGFLIRGIEVEGY